MDLYKDKFEFLPPGQEGSILFDHLAGTDEIRLGSKPYDELIDGFTTDLNLFSELNKNITCMIEVTYAGLKILWVKESLIGSPLLKGSSVRTGIMPYPKEGHVPP